MEATTVGVRPEVPVERIWLDDTSWVDVARGWLDGADELYAELVETMPWEQHRIFRYDHWVDEPRLGAWGRGIEHPALLEAQQALQQTYKVRFGGYGLAWYQHGRHGQAFHRDTDMKWLDDTVIALLTLGAQRPWYLRPRANRNAHHLPNKGATHDLQPGPGDLMVMGGTCQANWEHSVPQIRQPVGGRISVQWRWTSRTGRQFRGGSYGDPLRYSR